MLYTISIQNSLNNSEILINIEGLRSTSDSNSRTSWMLPSRTNSAGKSKVEGSLTNVDDTRESAPNEDSATTEPTSSNTVSEN